MLVRPSAGNESSDSSPQATRTRQQPGAACDECRRRKLRCDRQRPQCGACQTSGVACVVPVTKPARGPKRGYLKTLQARISALEGALSSGQQCNPSSAGDVPSMSLDMADIPDFKDLGYMSAVGLSNLAWPLGMPGECDSLPSTRPISYDEKDILSTLEAPNGWSELIQDAIQPGATQGPAKQIMAYPEAGTQTNSSPQTPANTDESSSPGCSPDILIPSPVQSDLDQLYVDRIHTFIPIVHHGRCAEWAKSEPGSICEAQTALRNAMWTLAASASAYHLTLRESLYQRTRQALENLDQRACNAGDATTCTAPPDAPADTEVVQAWLLLAVHELMCVSFRRAWITAGRAFRLIQLNPSWTTADGDVFNDIYVHNQHHHPQWTEIEQRRRTFWFAYCFDRLMSLRNGSPPTFGERVSVRLPCPEAAFQYGQPVPMGFLEPTSTTIPASSPSTMVTSSPFHECIVAATVAGHVLSHRRQTIMDTASMRETGNAQSMFAFWDRHVWLDSLVADSMGSFAVHHPPAAQERDPMLLFLAVVWRAITLYLWHTAECIPAPVSGPELNDIVGIESSSAQMADRAAHEVLRLMGKISGLNSWKVHPLMSLPLTLCAELLAPRPDLMAAFSQKLKEIMQEAHSLGPLSGAVMQAY